MSKKQKRMLLAGLLVGVMLEGLDGTILGAAMPRIVSDLDGLALISWVFTAYMLTSVITTPIYGKLSDLYGRKLFYAGGMALFITASMLAGQAQSIEWLIFWRGVQGLGAGAMMPIAHAIGFDVFKGPETSQVQGVLGAGLGVSSLLGPFVGGWLTDGPGWRWAFYINLPLGLVAIGLILLVKFPATSYLKTGTKPKVDYAGTITLMLFTLSLLLGFVFAGDATVGWTNSQTLLSFGVAVLSLAGFIMAEHRATDPILPLWFFRNPTFVIISLVAFLVGAVLYTALNYTSLFIQGVQGNSATSSGMAITPLMLGLIVGVVFGGGALAHLGKYRVLATVAILFTVGGSLQLVMLSANSSGLQMLLAVATLGFGAGVSFPVFVIALQNAFSERYIGSLTSLNDFFRLIGGTVGTTVMGSLLTNTLTSDVPARLKTSLGEATYTQLLAGGFKPSTELLTSSEGLNALRGSLGSDTLYKGVVESLRMSLAEGLQLAFSGSLVVSVAALVIILFLKETPLRWSLRRAGLHGGHAQRQEETITQEAVELEVVSK